MSFALFPIVMFLKLNAGQSVREKNDFNGDNTTKSATGISGLSSFNVLSFISKIPLQVRPPPPPPPRAARAARAPRRTDTTGKAFFALGAFNRERIAPVGGDFADDIAETQDDFNARVVASSIWPGAAAVVFGLVTLWIFSGDLRLGSFGDFLAKIGWFLAAAALLGVAAFLPVLLAGGDRSVSTSASASTDQLARRRPCRRPRAAHVPVAQQRQWFPGRPRPRHVQSHLCPDNSRASPLRYVYQRHAPAPVTELEPPATLAAEGPKSVGGSRNHTRCAVMTAFWKVVRLSSTTMTASISAGPRNRVSRRSHACDSSDKRRRHKIQQRYSGHRQARDPDLQRGLAASSPPSAATAARHRGRHHGAARGGCTPGAPSHAGRISTAPRAARPSHGSMGEPNEKHAPAAAAALGGRERQRGQRRGALAAHGSAAAAAAAAGTHTWPAEPARAAERAARNPERHQKAARRQQHHGRRAVVDGCFLTRKEQRGDDTV